jgi:hypothetical protein
MERQRPDPLLRHDTVTNISIPRHPVPLSQSSMSTASRSANERFTDARMITARVNYYRLQNPSLEAGLIGSIGTK